ncbi:hypothetical protein JCM18237_20810 [Halorubrum luteum]
MGVEPTAYVQFFDPYGDRSRYVLVAVGVLVALAAVTTAGAFLADPADAAPDPVRYDDAVELGLSAEADELMAGSATVPKAQVFYSGFQYVVGYNGIESLVDALDDDRVETQFGHPLAVYVQTFDGTDTTVGGDGLFDAERRPSWTPADEAVYVVGSDARTPAGETVIPFADRSVADAFVDEHGGEVVAWAALRERSFDVDTARTVRSMAPARWTTADDRVADAQRRADRPVSVVVGEDEPTVAAAVEAAPPNTTVLIPPGEYAETVEVTKPLTIAGGGGIDDAHPTIRGDGNGSVITARAPDVAIRSVHVAGTGNQTRDADAVRDPPGGNDASDDGEDGNETDDGDITATWDTNVQLGYGHGDAGIRGIGAPGLVVEDVHVETNASGVLLRGGSHATITELSVDGTDDWRDGFMGVVGMESRVTLTDGEFVGGRDGVYLHRADGSVIRNATFRENRYGVHLMYTGDTLIADNDARDAVFGGITVMTRPEGNAIVGNHVRGSAAGIQASGTRTYVGYNTLVDNGLGLSTSSRQSLYERNVLAGNEEGARATTVVPSSRVVANDFVANDRHAGAGAGALRIWADGDVGNYWEGADARFSDAGDRGYRPTSPVDAAFHRDPAAVTLSESPAATLLDRLVGTAAGSRTGSILDPAPAAEPYAPDRVAAATGDADSQVRADWRSALSDPANGTATVDRGGYTS